MKFLTVGTQLPFDRLVRAVDNWCGEAGCSDVFGQIGDPGPHGYTPRHFEWTTFVEPDQFKQLSEQADLIISHAGMGSIISALTLGTPVVIMPRRADLQEHRNDHQLATVLRLRNRKGMFVVYSETDVTCALDRLMNSAAEVDTVDSFAEASLTGTIRSAILGDPIDGEAAQTDNTEA